MQIFLARNNVQAGPYSLDQLNIMLTSGEVTLDDLVWHDGLDKWQRVGDLTGNQRLYRPAATPTTSPLVTDGIINNVTVFPEDTANGNHNGNNVSLDRLYGKSESNANSKVGMTTNRQHTPSNVSLNKSATSKDIVVGDVVLAPIMSRLLATAIDWLLLIMAFLPLFMAVNKLGGFPTDVESMDQMLALSLSLAEKIPQGTQLISNAMLLGLVIIQLLFIILRGQSIGKVITGIRVVDQTTHRIPSFLRLVLIRIFLLVVLYMPFLTTLSPIMLAINYYMASKNPHNIGWHDKLAKTLVVKADNNQLTKLPK